MFKDFKTKRNHFSCLILYLNKASHGQGGGKRSFQACESQRLIEEGLHGKVREENPHECRKKRGPQDVSEGGR